MNRKLRINIPSRHHPRKWVIQYSAAYAVRPDRRGVLDARLRGHDSEWVE
jgi:hypothetical protein